MDPKDEFVHDYPKDVDIPWKENWYFNFIDKKNNAWGINHISLMRDKGEGRFAAIHVIDGQIMIHINIIDIDRNFQEITDGKLKIDFLDPFKKFKLTLDGAQHKVTLDYAARFEVFDYASGKNRKTTGNNAMDINHYEQALTVKGTIEKDGRTKSIDCLGHRDHSWGYRDESKVTGWNWAAIQMDNETINMSRVILGKAFLANGFISDKTGNTRIVKVSVDNTEFENSLPVRSTFIAKDENGKIRRFKSEKFSGLYLPMKEKGVGVAIHENFSEYTDLDTGETGLGIDEYLINPNI